MASRSLTVGARRSAGTDPLAPSSENPRRRRRFSLRSRRTLSGYLFCAPSILVFGTFMLYPIFQGVRVSLYKYNPFSSTYIGLQNYRDLTQDPRFWNALRNTLMYAFIVTVVMVTLALLLAMLLNSSIAFRAFSRSVLFMPFVLSMAVVAICFTFLLDPDIGWLSYVLTRLGMPPIAYLRDPFWAMIAVMVVGVWKGVGYFMVIFIAGLQQIPKELYEAAEVDGANPIQRFWRVTLPLLSNTTMIVSVLALIGGFQVFDQIYVMTGGGPYFSTESLVALIYFRGFGELKMGYSSAIAVIFTAIILVFSFAQIRFFNRRVVEF